MGRDVPCDIIGRLHQHLQQLVPVVGKLWDDAEDGYVAEPLQQVKVNAARTQQWRDVSRNDRPAQRA